MQGGHNGVVEFWDCEEMTLLSAGEHFMAQVRLGLGSGVLRCLVWAWCLGREDCTKPGQYVLGRYLAPD